MYMYHIQQLMGEIKSSKSQEISAFQTVLLYLHVIGVWKSSRQTVHVIVPVFRCRFLKV